MPDFRSFIRFLVYSNLFIGLCAVALAAETFFILHLPASLNWYLLLLFCCTVFVYSLHYYAKLYKEKTDSRLEWCRRNKKVLLVTLIASAILIAGGVLFHFNAIFFKEGKLNYSNLSWFIIIPLVALAYSHPLLLMNKKALRQVGWLKMASLSFIWSFTTTLLPVFMLAADHPVSYYALLVLFIHRFLFMASLSVLFNIHDYDEDKADGVKTIAVLLGPEQSLRKGKWLSLTLGIISTLWLVIVFRLYNGYLYAAITIPLILVFLAWHRFRREEEEAFFVVRYDGLMIVKALLLIFALLTL